MSRSQDGFARRSIAIALASSCLLAAGPSPAEAMVQRTIQIDGDFADWQGVLVSPGNTVTDAAADLGDPDAPPDGARDLRTFAATWDRDDLYLYWQRTTSELTTDRDDLALLVYIDVDYDADLDGDDVLVGLRANKDDLRDAALFRYAPAGTADALPGDGQAPAGTFGDLFAQPSGHAEPNALREFEAQIAWSDLGLPPWGGPLHLQPALVYVEGMTSSGKIDDLAPLLPSSVVDNGAVLDTGFGEVSVSPGKVVAGQPGGVIDLAHQLVAGGNVVQTFELRAVLGGQRIELWSDPDADGDPSDGVPIAVDVDGDGGWLDPGDSISPGWDTTADFRPDTGSMMPGSSMALVVRVSLPDGEVNDTFDVVSSVQSADRPTVAEVVTDVIQVFRLSAQPDRDGLGVAGDEVRFAHAVCSYNPVEPVVGLAAVSASSWPVRVERAGAPVTSISLLPGDCADVEVVLSVPAVAAIGDSDTVTLFASSTNPPTLVTAEDRLTVAEPIAVTPDRTGQTLAGSSIFYGHEVTNATATPKVLSLESDDPSARFWSDPNGDGRPGDGVPISLTSVLAANGGREHFLIQVDVPPLALPGDVIVTDLRAIWLFDPAKAGTASDQTTVTLLGTFSGPRPSPAAAVFAGCSAIHALAGPLASSAHRFRWVDSTGSPIRVSPPRLPDSGGMLDDVVDLVPSDPDGLWRIELEIFDGTWLPLGVVHDFIVVRDLRPDGGAFEQLATDRQEYPTSGGEMAISALLENTSSHSHSGSSVVYVAYQDEDRDGQPSDADPYLRLDGQTASWASGAFTCRATGLPPVAPGESLLEDGCAGIAPLQFASDGGWSVHATWLTICGDVIAVRATGFNVGCSSSATVDAGLDRIVCANEATRLGPDTPDPGLTYAWSPIEHLDDPTSAQPWATSPASRTYTVTATDSNGCVVQDEVTLVVQPGPVADAGPSVTICAGDSAVIGLPPEAERSYEWSPPDGLDDAFAAEPIATPDASTSYTLSVTDDVSSCAASDVVVVDVIEPPPADAGPDRSLGSAIGPALCDPGLLYEWSPASDLDEPFGCNPVATPAATTEYCVTVRERSLGCLGQTDCTWVGGDTCPDLPDAGADTSGPATLGPTVCDPSVTYEWTPVEHLDDPAACNPVANPPVETEYCVVARHVVSGCVSAADCVTVAAGCVVPAEVLDLRAVAAGGDVAMSWLQTASAVGGYRAYRVEAKTDLGSAGGLLVATSGDSATTAGVDAGAIADASDYFYRVVGVCADGVTEGP